MNFRDWSIRRRIMLLSTLPVLLTVALLTALHMMERWSDVHRENESIARLMIENIGASAEYPLISGNYELLMPLIDAALAQPAIVLVRISNANGELVIDRQSNSYMGLSLSEIRLLHSDINREIVSLSEFSSFNEYDRTIQELGYIELGMTDRFGRDRELSILRQSLFTGLAVVILAALIGRYMGMTIVRPLESLSGFIRQLARGENWRRIDVNDGAEIGNLQDDGNRLALTLEKAEAEHERFTSQLLQEQQKTREASQAKSQFLAMMSHELRTPLNGAVGMLQLMDQSSSEMEFNDQKRHADTSLAHLTQLLDDVMVVVDTDSSQLPVIYEYCDIAIAMEPLFADLSGKASRKGLSLIVDIDPVFLHTEIYLPKSLVRQLLRHLSDNALKFTQQGVVVIELQYLRDDSEKLRIVVRDSGIGIPADQQSQVLEAFSQVSSSFNRRYDGLGLGLTICHHISQILAGHIAFEDNPGGGTCVAVTIPLISPQSNENDTVKAAPTSTTRGKVLIVEDNEVNLKVAEKMLNKVAPDVQISSVGSGEDCISLIQHQGRHFDLILLDCQMPGMDGFETSEQLRKYGFSGAIVACTANTTDKIEQRCMDAGMDDYMAKPIRLDNIRDMLDRWLKEIETTG
ncbi:response regulator [Thalassolituus sp.]|jgi:signal transduction histidine kinase/ActR/RegA family two-component response regulator|uniref:ATP-binding response regulator n=1 Tax=Thalassolituus sp. TaxID=2030822 RepID=UPI002A829F90|nr:response regulator [Thalassolituus sp.]|tara:strand:+ start:6752 stop:8647 length:1896 start_codon:yes stop_codon:yes gene_type:complete